MCLCRFDVEDECVRGGGCGKVGMFVAVHLLSAGSLYSVWFIQYGHFKHICP